MPLYNTHAVSLLLHLLHNRVCLLLCLVTHSRTHARLLEFLRSPSSPSGWMDGWRSQPIYETRHTQSRAHTEKSVCLISKPTTTKLLLLPLLRQGDRVFAIDSPTQQDHSVYTIQCSSSSGERERGEEREEEEEGIYLNAHFLSITLSVVST